MKINYNKIKYYPKNVLLLYFLLLDKICIKEHEYYKLISNLKQLKFRKTLSKYQDYIYLINNNGSNYFLIDYNVFNNKKCRKCKYYKKNEDKFCHKKKCKYYEITKKYKRAKLIFENSEICKIDAVHKHKSLLKELVYLFDKLILNNPNYVISSRKLLRERISKIIVLFTSIVSNKYLEEYISKYLEFIIKNGIKLDKMIDIKLINSFISKYDKKHNKKVKHKKDVMFCDDKGIYCAYMTSEGCKLKNSGINCKDEIINYMKEKYGYKKI